MIDFTPNTELNFHPTAVIISLLLLPTVFTVQTEAVYYTAVYSTRREFRGDTAQMALSHNKTGRRTSNEPKSH